MNLVFLGPPGAGKGTIAKVAKEALGVPHISTGDLFRANIKNETELGKRVKEILASGGLVPDEITIKMVENRLSESDCEKGYILDGFPRTIPQAKSLKAMLEKRGAKVNIVLGLEVDEAELIDRLIKRGLESGRSDDNLETIKKRLVVYHNQTSPLKQYYLDEGKYAAIEGSGSIDAIFNRIKDAVDKVRG